MSVLTLADAAKQMTIAIRVKDRDKMIVFYKDTIGFALKKEENTLAIMGVKEKERQYLWLEESPRAAEHFGEVKKLKQYTIAVSNVEELSDVYYRLKQASYPVVQTSYDDKAYILVDDPEGNRLEIIADMNEKQVENDEQLLALSTKKATKLSQATVLQQIQLNVTAPEKEIDFLQNNLGFYLGNNNSTTHSFKKSDLEIVLHKSDSQLVDIESAEVLGLEIIRFVVTSDVLEGIQKHLAKIGKGFYIDKKRTILTVYDPAGIEWWFVLKNDK
ncbi:VOC family protein [Tetragenococcus halophilus]|uniref:VOC family protein n=1 Tax=Tetragenococcus halophilus TaxID=51669 RepID=UPI0030C8F97F